MVRLASALLGLLPFVAAASARSLPRQFGGGAPGGGAPGAGSAGTSVYQFQGGWIENLATRANGHLLVTRMDVPELWSVDPAAKTATKLHTFADALATGGMAEVKPDVWAVIAGKYSMSGGNTPGSWGVWKVDLTGASPVAEVIKVIPESQLFNGLTTTGDGDTIIIGDAAGGSVYKLSMSTGAYEVILKDASMNPQGFLPFGIDGLKYNPEDKNVYFTNIGQGTFNKFPIDESGKAGAITRIFQATGGDDFAFGSDGNAYIAMNTGNAVVKVTAAGQRETLATLGSTTSATFGRGEADQGTLYVGTSSGQILALDVGL